jgi:hypothetical protein
MPLEPDRYPIVFDSAEEEMEFVGEMANAFRAAYYVEFGEMPELMTGKALGSALRFCFDRHLERQKSAEKAGTTH